MSLNINGVEIETDPEGYLANLDDWTPEVAEVLAQQDNLVLGDNHWRIINFLRDYKDEYGVSPNLRFHKYWATPRKMSSNRLIEISWWLEENEYDNYMIVDDDPSLVRIDSNVVINDIDDHLLYVNYSNGISGAQFFRGCEILNIPREYDLPSLTFQGMGY